MTESLTRWLALLFTDGQASVARIRPSLRQRPGLILSRPPQPQHWTRSSLRTLPGKNIINWHQVTGITFLFNSFIFNLYNIYNYFNFLKTLGIFGQNYTKVF